MATPKPPMAIPATRFIQSMPRLLNRSRKWPLIATSAVHHSMAPRKIPSTKARSCAQALCRCKPSAVRIARNESTTVGFVRFNRKAVTKAECPESRFLSSLSERGFRK